jgi:hypothetical protein
MCQFMPYGAGFASGYGFGSLEAGVSQPDKKPPVIYPHGDPKIPAPPEKESRE